MSDVEDMAERFGAKIDVERSSDEQGFFLVKREESVDHHEFARGLLAAIGGPDRLLLNHPDGLFVVHITLERAEWLRTQPSVALVGGVQVDLERLQQMLG